MVLRGFALCVAALLALSRPAGALVFEFTTVSGDSLTPDQAGAFQAAADTWSSLLSDPITVSLRIGFSAALGDQVLGATVPVIGTGSAGFVSSLLAADATSGTDTQAVASLRSVPQGALAVTAAQAKALGAGFTSGPGSDGTIEFSSRFAFSTSRNADGTIAPGTFDLIGIAEHEIGHLLGFFSGLDGGSGGIPSLLDVFRYGAAGTRSFTAGMAAFFSIDGGVTDLADFATGVVNGRGNQASHWLPGTPGVMVPEAGAGDVRNIMPIDVLALDAIGYDLAALTSVPEPGSLSVLGCGVLASLGMRRRRTARQVAGSPVSGTPAP